MSERLSALADILLRSGWTCPRDAQWTELAGALPSIAALLAPELEAERDKVRADYRQSIRSTAEEFKRLRSEMEALERDLQCARDSHDAQRRNTIAFMQEAKAAEAELVKLKASKPKMPLCWGCEGNPSGENDPCEVCGLSSRAALSARSLEVE